MNLQLLLTGISMGVVYGFIAMGMVLIYRAVGVVNFAQGDFLMLGGFFYYAISEAFQLNPWISLLITTLLIGLSGIVFQYISYWPLRNAQDKAVVVSTLGASIVLRELTKIIWGATPLATRPLVAGTVKVGPAVMQWQYLIIIALAIVVVAFIYILLEKTLLGNIMQATAQDQYAASLMGIPVGLAIAITFFFSMLVTGLSGVLLSPIFFVTSTMGVTSGVMAFAAVVIGGFGSIPGAIIGGLLIGLVEIFGGTYISSIYKDTIVFLVLIVSLLIRPKGIFSEKTAEKA